MIRISRGMNTSTAFPGYGMSRPAMGALNWLRRRRRRCELLPIAPVMRDPSSIPSIELAQRLIEFTPCMSAVFFTSGGAEANEPASKLLDTTGESMEKKTNSKSFLASTDTTESRFQAMSATGISEYWKMFGSAGAWLSSCSILLSVSLSRRQAWRDYRCGGGSGVGGSHASRRT